MIYGLFDKDFAVLFYSISLFFLNHFIRWLRIFLYLLESLEVHSFIDSRTINFFEGVILIFIQIMQRFKIGFIYFFIRSEKINLMLGFFLVRIAVQLFKDIQMCLLILQIYEVVGPNVSLLFRRCNIQKQIVVHIFLLYEIKISKL